ncbi:MAG: tetratricopeptide repeat protein [Planctomycetales bacterium]|nr:tetratricopeptide repeat protein [Planctomycetales bacterium]
MSRAPSNSPAQQAETKRVYVRAVSPRLRKVLYVVFALVALLGANALYLSSVTFLEFATGRTYQDFFYQYMFLLHLALGILLIVPYLVFGLVHMKAASGRRNRRAVKIGYALFIAGVAVLVTGILLTRVGSFDLKQPLARSVVYWLHIATPLAAAWLYWLHRLAGPRIKWRVARIYGFAVLSFVMLMLAFHSQDPRDWFQTAPAEGAKYFEPSLARTANGRFVSQDTMMMDDYCKSCGQDVYNGWFHSVHHISSFNNPAYLASVRETRRVVAERDGTVKASRWCAGCHDPVPFFSGAFDDPNYDDVNDVTAHAGITCTSCHGITHVNSTKGNADYVIEEPMHYPFAYIDNPWLQYVNHTLVKAKPSFHKKTFLKPFHKSAEFCSTCHKVHLPKELTGYKEFLRGQNHYDNYLLSGVSGHGARSFYYPPTAQDNCYECHMPRVGSRDFGARPDAKTGELQVHNHLFLGANTGIAWWRNEPQVIEAHQKFLKECMRVDIFGVKEGGQIDGELHAPLRPEVPTLEPGHTYLLETVVRTLKLGHLFTQGTVDSNEIWLEVIATSGDRVIGRSGSMDDSREVDPWSHFLNVFMLDKNGNRISRRNAQDIFVPLYNHQIPPGAGQVVHYSLSIPQDVVEPVRVELRLNYRKFDKQYTDFMVAGRQANDRPLRGLEDGTAYINDLPITVMASDVVVFPVTGGENASVSNEPRDIPEWQRWNDYGIGLFLKGKAELRQAADAFARVEELNRYDGPLNLARVLHREGRLDEAVDALNRAANYEDPAAPPWTMAWLSGLVNREQGRLAEAEHDFRKVLEDRTPEMIERGFDFQYDIEVGNLLGATLFDQAKQHFGEAGKAERMELLRSAAVEFEKTLEVDSEDVTAHYNLAQLYAQLGESERADEHRAKHAIYKPDDNARPRAVALARRQYPAANHAAEALVIYSLNREQDQGSE